MGRCHAEHMLPEEILAPSVAIPSTAAMPCTGDDDQILYEHLGADPRPFLDAGATDELVLPQSFRIPAAVHTWSQAWIQQLGERRRPKPFAARDHAGAVTRLRATYRAPQVLCDDIGDQLTVGHSVMVLATCGYMLNRLLKELRAPRSWSRDRSDSASTSYSGSAGRQRDRWNGL